MKKIFCFVLIAAAVASALAGCGGKKFICDECGKKKSGHSYCSEFMGEESVMCQDCYKEFKELLNMLDESLAQN